ncbi:MAG: PIN domain-containing protein [Candidatus Dojkabacteria bacterium]
MKRYCIDTNAILRFILKDIPEQHTKTKELFEKASQGKVVIILLTEVIMELLYVLTKAYKLEKKSCVDIIVTLLEHRQIELAYREKAALMHILETYLRHNLDFVDILLYQDAKIHKAEIFSFDQDFKKIKN